MTDQTSENTQEESTLTTPEKIEKTPQQKAEAAVKRKERTAQKKVAAAEQEVHDKIASEQEEIEKAQEFERFKSLIGKTIKLDANRFVPPKPGFKRMWINNQGGSLQKWINVGAVLLTIERPKHIKIYEGINDHSDNSYIKIPGGTDAEGKPFDTYLLEIPEHLYYEVKIKPIRDRQMQIHQSMGIAEMDPGDITGIEGKIRTYAATNAEGKGGFSQNTGAL